MFVARRSRYFFVRKAANYSSAIMVSGQNGQHTGIIQQTFTYMTPAKHTDNSQSFDLWLVCPPKHNGGIMHPKKINAFSAYRKAWIIKPYPGRDLYR